MDILSLVLISIGLAMDAFAVSLTEGLAMKKLRKRNIFKNRTCIWRISGFNAVYRVEDRWCFCRKNITI